MSVAHLNEVVLLELEPEPELGSEQVAGLLDRRDQGEVRMVNLKKTSNY